MDLISPFIDLLKEGWENIKIFHIVMDYEHGVKLKFGKFHSKIEAGIVWKWPIIDDIMLVHNTITTMVVNEQSLTTKDEKDIVISCIVKYKITNPKTFLLEVEDVVDAINDITKAKIKNIIVKRTWEEIKTIKDQEISEEVEKEVKNWGIKIYYITITDLAKIRTIRLINSSYDKEKINITN